MRQLRYFVLIVESGSLSKASRQLFIAQPALSQQMSRLEEEVGKPLLVRSVRGVSPTQNGEALYHHAKFLLRQLDEAMLVARQESSSIKGRVTLGLAGTTGCILGLPLLKHMREKYPGIVLNLVEAIPGHLEDMARLGQFDLAILFSETAASDLSFEPLVEEEAVVILAADSDLVAPHKESLTLAEVAALPLTLSNPRRNLRHKLNSEFQRANLVPNVIAEIDSMQLMKLYVAGGEVATIMPMSAILAFDSPDQWRCLPISDTQISRVNYLYALPFGMLSTRASIVRAELKQVVWNLVREGSWTRVKLLTSPIDEGEG